MIIDINGTEISIWEKGKLLHRMKFSEVIVRDNGAVVLHVL